MERIAELLADGIHDGHSGDIVATLGGIDKILTEFIRISEQYENEELLNSSQIQQITDILNQEHTQTIWDKIYAMANLRDDTFHLNRSDTLLHRICRNRIDKQTIDRLVGVLFSKITLTIYTVLTFAAFIPRYQLRGQLWWFIVEFTYLCSSCVYFVLLILSCNVPAFLLVISGFDFWVKLYYAILYGVTQTLYRVRNESDIYNIYTSGILSIVYLFVIITVSLIEGYGSSWKTAFGFTLLIAVLFSWKFLDFMWFSYDMYPEEEFVVFEGLSIELKGWIIGTLRILCLFLWKQAIMAVYTKGEWCICIFLSPYIKWYDDDHDAMEGNPEKALDQEMQRTTDQGAKAR